VGTEFRLAAYSRATLVTSDFSHSKNCAVINQVPLGRYFAFVGSLLLGMLFVADWYLPSASSQPFFQEARVDKSIIRITSAQKWPEPIVIDTSLPTIVPPLPVVAKVNQPREALAQLNSPWPKAYPGRLERSAKSLHKPDRREPRLIERSQRRCPLVGNIELLGSFGLVPDPIKDFTRRQSDSIA
jgi:hypothetical protein